MFETLEDWFTSDIPFVLFYYLSKRYRVGSRPGGKRKCRLTACATARSAWDLLPDARYKAVIEASERHLNRAIRRQDESDAEEIQDQFQSIQNMIQTLQFVSVAQSSNEWMIRNAYAIMRELRSESFDIVRTRRCCSAAADIVSTSNKLWRNQRAKGEADSRISHAIRDLFGAVVRDFAAPTQWRTPHVLGLCHTFQDDPSEERILILADALEEAGCDDTLVLSHCRDEGPHYLGCWVVDSLLGIDIKKASFWRFREPRW